MDEPTVGMDITSRRAMWQMIEKIKSNFGSTVFLTTHYLEEADRLSDTICIMKDGKEIIQGTPDTLRTCMHRDMLEISFASGKDAGNCFSMLQAVFALDASDLRQDKIIIKSNGNSKDLNQINRWLLEHDVNFRSIGIVQPTLEDICINLLSTGKKETI
jgi:ABC-2 type transport system ATP-binding protein